MAAILTAKTCLRTLATLRVTDSHIGGSTVMLWHASGKCDVIALDSVSVLHNKWAVT